MMKWTPLVRSDTAPVTSANSAEAATAAGNTASDPVIPAASSEATV